MLFHILIYAVCALLVVIGLSMCLLSGNFIKKMLGITILQTSVLTVYIAMGFIEHSKAPVISEVLKSEVYSNPLSHVLMLTAIVVGVATLSIGLSIIVKIWKYHGTIEESELFNLED